MRTRQNSEEMQNLAESILGPISWNSQKDGHCACPGASKHTTGATDKDLHVVLEPMENVGPGCYCFHDSCEEEVDIACFELRSALGKYRFRGIRGKQGHHLLSGVRSRLVRPPKPVFDPSKLENLARKLPGADTEYIKARSPLCVDNLSPAHFLDELYQPGERIVVFDVFNSQGQAVWTHKAPFDPFELDHFRKGKPNGVWFLCNPVTGDYTLNDRKEQSRRSRQNVTSWRYLVVESDEASPALWLAALAQMPLPISAVYTSGGPTSIHALVRLDAESKEHWDELAGRLKPALITLGADRKAISAVRLTRLPSCERLGKTDKHGIYVPYHEPRLQQLIYLNPTPDLTPICEKDVIS